MDDKMTTNPFIGRTTDEQRQAAMDIATSILDEARISTHGYIPQARDTFIQETEVIFEVPGQTDDGIGTEAYRVFIDAYGNFLGLVLADGSNSDPRRSWNLPTELKKYKSEALTSESMAACATRYLEFHGVETADLTATVLDAPRMVCVWYKVDGPGVTMGGGGPELYITDDGTLIRMFTETQ